MDKIALTATYADEAAVWDVNLALERRGVDASRIEMTEVPPIAPDPSSGNPAGRLARRGIWVTITFVVLGVVGGIAIGAAVEAPWWAGLAIGAGLGLAIGVYWGITWSLPMNPDVLVSSTQTGVLSRITVRVDPDDETKISDVMTAASPVTGPTRIAAQP